MIAKRETTSIKIDPKLWREFKKYAIDKRTTVSELIEQLIKNELYQGKRSKS